MTERLLQYIWQFGYFNITELLTTSGDELQLLDRGTYNTNQGPDFQHAKARVNGQLWVGSIELHLKASDWFRHLHDGDANYSNVILHVVWDNDDERLQRSGIPALELNGRVARLLLQQYEAWQRNGRFIPCGDHIARVEGLVWTAWSERLLIERLQCRSKRIRELQAANGYDWNETFWCMLAGNFGLMINRDAFEAMARSVPVKILMRHRASIHQVEALLFGQAGLLNNDFTGNYPKMLQKEYAHLRKKYRLNGIHQRMQFLRMRPAAFPTVRIAELSMLVHVSGDKFGSIADVSDLNAVERMLHVTASDYWHCHYLFDEAAVYHPKSAGAQLVNSIMVNTIAPFVYAYGEYRGDERHISRAVAWMHELAAEQNATINGFKALGVEAHSAACSQALLELKTNYCDRRRCLDCAVGAGILKPANPFLH